MSLQVAFLLYDRFTTLDAVGPYEVLVQLPDVEPVFVAERAGPVRNDAGGRNGSGACEIVAERSIDDVPSPDMLLVPGGLSTREFLEHEPILEWIRRAHETTRYTTSVCTGALLLAAAGVLDGLQATTHWLARDLLATYGVDVVGQRVVEQGKVITAAGVSSGIDMALRIVQLTYGDDVARAVQLGIEYDPQPPFDAGAPEKVSDELAAVVSASMLARGTTWAP